MLYPRSYENLTYLPLCDIFINDVGDREQVCLRPLCGTSSIAYLTARIKIHLSPEEFLHMSNCCLSRNPDKLLFQWLQQILDC